MTIIKKLEMSCVCVSAEEEKRKKSELKLGKQRKKEQVKPMV